VRRVATFGAAALAVVLCWLVWVIGERNAAESRMERARRASRERATQPLDDAKGVKILQFYTTSGEVIEGKQGIICYGVRNAKSVRIEPPVENLYPSYSRCFWVEPKQDTTYKLIAEGFDGREVSEEFQVKVKPAPPNILFVSISDRQVRRGDPLTLCYGVQHADAVRLQPLGLNLRPVEKDCTRFYPSSTLKYTLLVTGKNGPPDRESFTVRVK
jgi:hypothetical protein